MIWFIKSKEGIPIARKEIPLSDYEINNLVDESQPINIWQSLMQEAPGHTYKIPADEPNILKEALLDCMEMMTEKDQTLINAIIYEQLTYPKLAQRLGCSTPHAWRMTQAAFKKLKELLLMHSTLMDYIDNEQ
jgi:DNA-directed RNA polymerase specialized sigma subunit